MESDQQTSSDPGKSSSVIPGGSSPLRDRWRHVVRGVEGVALLIILLTAAVLTFYRLDEPAWESGHQGFLISQHATNSRNMGRYGYLGSELCLLTCFGETVPASDGRQACGVRTDNPPLMHVLMSLCERMLGESEAQRAYPLPSAR